MIFIVALLPETIVERGFWLCGENNEKGYFGVNFDTGSIFSSAGTSDNVVIISYDIIK